MKYWLTTLTLCALMGASTTAAAEEWITLFDGKSLDGWKINERPESWKLEDGVLTCQGRPSHIFYVGKEAPFKDFELELEILTRKNSNAGVYICTRFQESGWPKGGFECQVNNTYNSDPRKTGSLYGVKDILEAPAKDDEWWTYNIRLEGKKITIKVNGKVVNEFIEPEGAQPGKDFDRVITEGTFALQAHDPGSVVSFRNIRVKKLAAGDASAKTGVSVGNKAPSFTLKDENGNDWKSDEHFAKGTTVVYFYPADFTSGCTNQACGYRDDFAKLAELGVKVVGVSGDSVETHKAFKEHHKLNFPLLSDAEGVAATKLGVPVTLGEKTAKLTVDGKELSFVRTATISRWTVIVKDGKIAAIDSQVNASEDSARVQKLVQGLK